MNINRDTRMKKSVINLFLWTALWVITLAIATFGKIFLWETNSVLSIAALLANIAAGIGMLFANAKHLATLDELEAKIQMKAMGLTLGIGLLVAVSLPSLVDWGLPESSQITALIIFMSFSYMSCILIEQLKYR